MALIACPECRQQVSTEAVSCPHCGKILSGVAPGATLAAGPGGVAFAPIASPIAEQPLWEGRPSVALLYGKVVHLLVKGLVLLAIAYFVLTVGIPQAASIVPQSRSFVEENGANLRLGISAILGLALLPAVFALVMAVARVRSTHYNVTTQRILIESGVFSKSLQEIDMRSVEDTQFHQTFMERIFDIGQVSVVSTDKVAPRLALLGIHDPRKTRELVRATAYAASQRQLFTRST